MSTELATQSQKPNAIMGFGSQHSFEYMLRAAKMLSASSLVPKQYRLSEVGSETAIANSVIALNMATRMGADPLMVMQNLYVVHGNPGWSSKYLIATVNTCGRFSSLRYEWHGEPGTPQYGCRAWAIERETGERLNGAWVDWTMVKAEKWQDKAGSKWNTMADQMFIYRAAAFWTRAYAPELSMGLQTMEELYDVGEIDGVEVQTRRRKSNGNQPMKPIEGIGEPEPESNIVAEPKEVIDEQTGEVYSQESSRKDNILIDVANAKTVDELNECLDFARSLDAAEKAEVDRAVVQRKKDIEKGGYHVK